MFVHRYSPLLLRVIGKQVCVDWGDQLVDFRRFLQNDSLYLLDEKTGYCIDCILYSARIFLNTCRTRQPFPVKAGNNVLTALEWIAEGPLNLSAGAVLVT